MAEPWTAIGLVLPVGSVGELVSLTLILSTIEYTLIGLFIGKAVHGKKLRGFAAARGWEWRKGDPEGSLQAAAPAALGKKHGRRVKSTIRGEVPQGPFTLWVHVDPWRWRNGRTTVLVETRMPLPSPGLVIQPRDPKADEAGRYPKTNRWFLEDTLTPSLTALIRTHPDFTWDWTGDRLIVSSTKIKGMDTLQDLVYAADKFRALAPKEAPTRTTVGEMPDVAVIA